MSGFASCASMAALRSFKRPIMSSSRLSRASRLLREEDDSLGAAAFFAGAGAAGFSAGFSALLFSSQSR
ncbi:hypothetical protein D3C83_299540 [compost metagenome]